MKVEPRQRERLQIPDLGRPVAAEMRGLDSARQTGIRERSRVQSFDRRHGLDGPRLIVNATAQRGRYDRDAQRHGALEGVAQSDAPKKQRLLPRW